MNGLKQAVELSEGDAHPGDPYHLRMDDDFRQPTFAEFQIHPVAPDGSRNVGLSVEGESVTRVVVLNVIGEALREALNSFGENNLALWPG